MRKNITLLVCALLLSACGDSEKGQNEPLKIEFSAQKNDVPDVDIKEVNGKQEVFMNGAIIKAAAFRDKYCIGKGDNKTCNKVALVVQIQSTSGGAIPRSW
jgi:hypothetical protein